MRFAGKVALVTGASSGIGRAIAVAFAQEGAKVALVARSEDRLQLLADELQARGTPVLVCVADVSVREEVERAAAQTFETFGRIDLLINNAGRGMFAPLDVMSLDEYHRLVEVNVWSVLYAIQAVVPRMKQQRAGVIINIASILGKVTFPNLGGYSATKHALVSLSDALRMEVEPFGMEVISICPGRVQTDFRKNAARYRDDVYPPTAGGISADEVARAVVDAVWKHKREVVIPRAGWLLIALNRLWPRAADRLAKKFSNS